MRYTGVVALLLVAMGVVVDSRAREQAQAGYSIARSMRRSALNLVTVIANARRDLTRGRSPYAPLSSGAPGVRVRDVGDRVSRLMLAGQHRPQRQEPLGFVSALSRSDGVRRKAVEGGRGLSRVREGALCLTARRP